MSVRGQKNDTPHPVPLVVANETTLKGYGTIVTDFDKTEVEITPWPVNGRRKLQQNTGNGGGVVSGDYLFKWEGHLCKAVNKAVDRSYVTGRLPPDADVNNRTCVLIRDFNYHPDGGQIFFPQNAQGGAFVAVLALPGDDVKPDDFVAFYFDGSFGFQIHANVWHQSVYPLNDNAVFLGKQGAIHACVCADMVDEFNTFLSVPLYIPK